MSFFRNFIAGHGLLTGFYVLFGFVFQNGVLICYSRPVLTSTDCPNSFSRMNHENYSHVPPCPPDCI